MLRFARNGGYSVSVDGGAPYGLNAPPGTAEATELSKPSLLTDETPNIQSSTRIPFRTLLYRTLAMGGSAMRVSWCWGGKSAITECSQFAASVLRQCMTYLRTFGTKSQLNVVSVLTAPSTLGSGGGGALAVAARAAVFRVATVAR